MAGNLGGTNDTTTVISRWTAMRTKGGEIERTPTQYIALDMIHNAMRLRVFCGSGFFRVFCASTGFRNLFKNKFTEYRA